MPSIGNQPVVVHDPDEEVGREERSEEHDLGDDEKQHPEELRLDARGEVGRGRPVVLVVGGRVPAATDADSISRSSSLHDVLDRLAGGRLHAADQVGAQPARARLGEGGDDDVVRRVELERVLDRRVRDRGGPPGRSPRARRPRAP